MRYSVGIRSGIFLPPARMRFSCAAKADRSLVAPEHSHAMRSSMLKCGPVILVVLVLALAGAAQAQWHMLGPFGGNARALAYDPSDPDHILLGSGAGALFESLDGGLHWRPFAQLGPGHELMLEDIAFDPSHPATIYVAGWSITASEGGFFLPRDGGRSWSQPAALQDKSIQNRKSTR